MVCDVAIERKYPRNDPRKRLGCAEIWRLRVIKRDRLFASDFHRFLRQR